jgi:hypothetical protein
MQGTNHATYRIHLRKEATLNGGSGVCEVLVQLSKLGLVRLYVSCPYRASSCQTWSTKRVAT